MSTVQAEPRLTPQQIEHYRTEGYVHPIGPVFSQSKFDALKAEFESLLGQWPADERPEAMDTPHFEHHQLLEWALSDEVVDIVEPLLGPDILLFSTHFICKPKGDGRRVPWHEDSAYWRKAISPMEVATVWLAIDPSTKVNGCMHVIPRTHNTGKAGYSDYDKVDKAQNVFATEITPSQRNDALAVAIELEPNECSLHDARLMHGSPANTSDIRRCGWTMRFIPAHVELNPENRPFHVIYQARGRNLTGQPLADPGRSYPEIMATRRARNVKSH